MRQLILLLTVLSLVVGLRAENKMLHTLYTTDDGLSQNRVMDIEQDKKGFLWFATWDGLNRFDGKSFRIYKGVPGDPEGLDNNRLMSVQADAYGYLWLLTGNGEVYRFNPDAEQFKRMSYNPDTQSGMIKHTISRIVVLKENKVALLTHAGCYLVRINPDGTIARILFLSRENGKLAGNWVREVFTRGMNDVWFLTNTGITNFNYSFNQTRHFFNQEKNTESFRCSFQTEERLYVGTESGKVWYRDKVDNTFKGKQLSLSYPISGICQLPGNTLMVTTLGEGFYVTDVDLRVLRHYQTTNHPELGNNRVNSLYADNKGLIWLDVDATGFVFYDTKQGKLYHRIPQTEPTNLHASGRLGNRVLDGSDEQTWLYARNGGLFTFNRTNNTLQPVSILKNTLGAQNLRLLTDALVDKDGNLWISSGEPRLEKITIETEKFVFTPVPQIRQSMEEAEVRTLFEDRQHRIWVCDKEGKIQLMDKNRHTLGWLRSDGSLSSTGQETDMMVYDMIQDTKGRIWMACKGAGVVLLHEKKGQTLAFTLRYLNHEMDAKARINSTLCYSVLEDTHGRIWVGVFGGGLNLVKETNGSFSALHGRNGLNGYPVDSFPNIRDLAIDKMGTIWVATDNGLVAFDSEFSDPTKVHFHTYRRKGNDPGSLRTNDVHCIHIDKQNNRWFGTFGGGLNVLDGRVVPGEKVSFRSYTQKSGLPSDIVLSIEEDFMGFFWLFSENSITRFDTKTYSKDVYNKDFGLDPVMFSESSTLLSSEGEIFAGTMKGFYRFNPLTVKKETFTPPLYFTGLFLFDEKITANAPDGILSQNIDKVERIVLKKEQSVFSIEFAALDFRNPKNIQYAYKLEPINSEWVSINKVNRITFSRLAAGEYTLTVRSTNSEGVWMDNKRSVGLVIMPSMWETTWALILYILIGGLMLFFALRMYLKKFRSRNKVSVENKISEAKKQFLATVTRELRTPLMLMEGSVEQLSLDKGLSFDSKNNLSIVKRNIDRMMRLITRILDFQKKQEDKMTLMVEETPVGALCDRIAANFETIAQERGIRFNYSDQSNGMAVYLDKEKFDTILHILLTNAIRFTKGEKTVSLSVRQENNDVVVRLADEGLGISKENMPFIFEPLNVVEETDVESGIGIGLSLAKELVELHGGNIAVTSKKGIGTTFELSFKMGKDHFSNTHTVLFQSEYFPGEISTNEAMTCLDQDVKNQCIQQQLFMVVENQLDPTVSISNLLANHFRVAEIKNSNHAWSEIDRLMPDYVIIDTDTSGNGWFDLIKRVKENERTCHIPVVLVANKSVEPFNSGKLPEGVDELISKPFNASFLEARLEQVFIRKEQQRNKLLKDVLDATNHSFASTVSIEPSDAEFLSRVMDFLTENMSNSELTATLLVSVIGLGKSPFVSKLRSLLGLSPSDLIREVRLKHAMELLESGRYNVSEVVFQVGMKDVNAFSKCFLQHVGLSPYEFRSKSASLQK